MEGILTLAGEITLWHSEQQRQGLIQLLRHLCYCQGDFTLSSGKTSPHYLNCKPVTLHPQGAWLIGQQLLGILPSEAQAVAGMTLGADPLVTAVSLAGLAAGRFLPALIVRKQPKGHGTQAWLEGLTLPTRSLVWILEDVVTTGGSALAAAERIHGAGYLVGGIVTLVDREEGGAATFASAGIPFRRLLTLAEVIA